MGSRTIIPLIYPVPHSKARAAYFRATQLGHPVAFVYLANHGQLAQAIDVTVGAHYQVGDSRLLSLPRPPVHHKRHFVHGHGLTHAQHVDNTKAGHWTETQRQQWAHDYILESGSALALWAWHHVYLATKRGEGSDAALLLAARKQEDTPHISFLMAEASGKYGDAAARNHSTACYRFAGGAFAIVNSDGQMRVPWEKRSLLLHIAAAQDHRRAVLALVIHGLARNVPEHFYLHARMLATMAASISDDRSTASHVLGIIKQRAGDRTTDPFETPMAHLRETGFYFRFLRQHVTHLLDNNDDDLRYLHGAYCAVCSTISVEWDGPTTAVVCRRMDAYSLRRARAHMASVTLLGILRRRNRWKIPRDLAVFLTRMVHSTFETAPHLWIRENMPGVQGVPTLDQQHADETMYWTAGKHVYFGTEGIQWAPDDDGDVNPANE